MRVIGLAVLVIGLTMLAYSLQMPTSLESQAARMLGMASNGGDGVYNIGLLQRQKMIFDGGIGLSVSGVTLAAAGYVTATIRRFLSAGDPD